MERKGPVRRSQEMQDLIEKARRWYSKTIPEFKNTKDIEIERLIATKVDSMEWYT